VWPLVATYSEIINRVRQVVLRSWIRNSPLGRLANARAADPRWALSAYRSRLALQTFFMSHILASRNLIKA
jgi:hypothetical protein